MACCHCPLSSSLLPSSHLPSRPQNLIARSHSSETPPISCNFEAPECGGGDDRKKKSHLCLLELSVTLSVVSSSLPRQSLAAAPKVAKKRAASKKPGPKKHKPEAALSPQELKLWSQGLPMVSDRVSYTEVLELKREGRLKHLIKPSTASLKKKPEVVIVVLDDLRALRTVLPSVEKDEKFWASWEELGVGSVCVNAYSPPMKGPELPSPYLGVFSAVLEYGMSLTKPKPVSKQALEVKKLREELKREKEEELRRSREEAEMVEKAIRNEKKMEARNRRIEQRKKQQEQSRREDYQEMANFWVDLSMDQNVSTVLGVLFFYIFYRTVVYNYKIQKKDYEDRLKIEKAEAEERKKMRDIERELEGIEAGDAEIGAVEGEDNLYQKLTKQFMKSGARVRRAGRIKLPEYLERDVDVKFSDVAGLGKIRLELEEIVKFFTHGEMYRRRGVKIPGGILLCGPPGVGKTLLAKAVAGEAGVNFFSISASQFVEIYVGVGASRVRSLYQEAKENAPSVVFIDELDAVGRERGLIKGSGGQERDATLNQLLVCLDGFEGRGNVITIASTNRPDILDPALVRPGRFDRKINIPKPGLIGRIEILQVHARKKPMAEDVDYMAVASMTHGMVGAELANIVEVAAINMMRDRRMEVTTDDMIQAAEMEERGMLDKRERSPEMWKQVAMNEAAMAVVAVNFPEFRNIEFVTIAPRAGRELGYVRMKMDNIKFKEGMLSRKSLLDYITVQLGPRAADEIWHAEDQLSTIWAETADNARSAARAFVLGGLSQKDHGLANFWVADRIDEIDLEARRVLEMCYGQAKEVLQQNRKLMNAVVDELVCKKCLTKKEFFHLVEVYGSLKPSPCSILDIRVTKHQEFQKLMTKQGITAPRTVV